MTTRVFVQTHKWAVDVTPISVGGAAVGPKRRVPPEDSAEFCVHSGQDLLIHEVQPEAATTAPPTPVAQEA